MSKLKVMCMSNDWPGCELWMQPICGNTYTVKQTVYLKQSPDPYYILEEFDDREGSATYYYRAKEFAVLPAVEKKSKKLFSIIFGAFAGLILSHA